MEYLKLPNFLLKGYVKKHYSEFSYEDFLNVVDRVKIPTSVLITNNKLLNNKDVLLKLLDVNPGVFRVFPESLMDEDVLNKLKPLYKKVFNVSDATQYKYLLNIEEVRVDFIKEYPAYINYIDSKYYDEYLINLYIDSYKGEIDLNIFKDRLDLLSDSELVKRIAKNNQGVIFLVDFISDDLAYLVINNGIDLTLEDFKNYPQLGKSMPLVNHVLKTIPDVVRYIDPSLCNPYLFSDAIEYGFKIQEEDLKNNDLFRNISSVMEAAVKINPSWIKYIGENCFMHSIYLDRALLEYDITLEDIYNNPDITKNFGLMCRLDGFKLYSKFLYDEIKKEEIINAIKEGRTLVNSGLPFLDKRFSTLVDVDKLQELYDSLNDNKSDEDIKVQDERTSCRKAFKITS